MPSEPSPRSARGVTLALVLVAGLLAGHAVLYWMAIDDSYIAFRYARNLLDGHGLVYNPGQYVEGYTSFAWVILIAALTAIWSDVLLVANCAGIVIGVIGLFLVWQGAKRLYGDSRWALLPAIVLAVDRTYAGWCTGGLETTLFTVLVLAGFIRWIKEGERSFQAVPWFAVLLGLATLTRPEGALYFGVLFVLSVPPVFTGRVPARRMVLMLLAYSAVVLPHLVWRFYYYGDLLPNTYYAKVNGAYWASGAKFLYLYLRDSAILPLLVVLGGIGWLVASRQTRTRRVALGALGLLAAHVLYVAYVGGDVYEFRFMDVVQPILALGVGLLAVSIAARPKGFPWALAVAASVVLAGAINVPYRLLTPGAHYSFNGMLVERLEIQPLNPAEKRVGEWLRQISRPGETLAIDAAGVIPYYSQLRTLDTYGLTDRAIARQPVPVRGWVGHEKRAPRSYIEAFGPTFFIRNRSKMIEQRSSCFPSPKTICVKVDDFYFSFHTFRPLEEFRRELQSRGAVVIVPPQSG